MPYWICFLGTAALVACITGCVALWEWLESRAPDWLLGVIVLAVMTAIVAVLPWALSHA